MGKYVAYLSSPR